MAATTLYNNLRHATEICNIEQFLFAERTGDEVFLRSVAVYFSRL